MLYCRICFYQLIYILQYKICFLGVHVKKLIKDTQQKTIQLFLNNGDSKTIKTLKTAYATYATTCTPKSFAFLPQLFNKRNSKSWFFNKNMNTNTQKTNNTNNGNNINEQIKHSNQEIKIKDEIKVHLITWISLFIVWNMILSILAVHVIQDIMAAVLIFITMNAIISFAFVASGAV